MHIFNFVSKNKLRIHPCTLHPTMKKWLILHPAAKKYHPASRHFTPPTPQFEKKTRNHWNAFYLLFLSLVSNGCRTVVKLLCDFVVQQLHSILLNNSVLIARGWHSILGYKGTRGLACYLRVAVNGIFLVFLVLMELHFFLSLNGYFLDFIHLP